MTRGTYWRCAACGFACDKDEVCPDCGYHTLVQEDFPEERKWVGLTDIEYSFLAEKYTGADGLDCVDYGRAIEAKLKEKNFEQQPNT